MGQVNINRELGLQGYVPEVTEEEIRCYPTIEGELTEKK